ncbi:16S rRNA (adenine(1518)-N(6)/adenine(1519)-N(6))-dimethyltransferase [Aliidiomarina shirensis]|uniref:Ribosomal RNA small subunit methyltransferase A n=1 Tax=Aliidiomarina shirensis TaxID=1048642 RepID=A0A432WR32_9GAMM|nr:16S rRNA (adenine(1518)-N(6)/adenine(1519)-N(6))-dimethyltransferase RsmA [Aliidiomarina shirensis]RUO36189.1 16S rRNA (adenine(1518)-N(6)/adenine(1519)-N(6))-dimethyltransferase [Aliidiomarina shirensis]
MSKALDGHRARKRFGQNFLQDEMVIDAIVEAIAPQPGEPMVEIGPGLAALTRPVAQRAGHLHVVELDRDLADRLENSAEFEGKLTVHRADALRYDFGALSRELGKELRVFGNLPYNISTPLIFHLLSQLDTISDMHFMLQKEVVARMAAAPGSKAFGRLTVMIQQACKVIPVIEVPPEAFDPTPKVDSAVVRLEPYSESPWPVLDRATLNHVCHMAFHQRRKTMRNNMKKLMSAEELESINIDPTVRPETLAVEDFVRMANWITENDRTI